MTALSINNNLNLILGISDFQQNFIPENEYQMQPCSSMQGNIRFNEPPAARNQNLDNRRSTPSALPTELNSLQKVEDILAVEKQQISSQAYCETTSDETLDKLSSLDLGIDPSDLDVNLSGITLDPFSESGLNFSTASMETKNS